MTEAVKCPVVQDHVMFQFEFDNIYGKTWRPVVRINGGYVILQALHLLLSFLYFPWFSSSNFFRSVSETDRYRRKILQLFWRCYYIRFQGYFGNLLLFKINFNNEYLGCAGNMKVKVGLHSKFILWIVIFYECCNHIQMALFMFLLLSSLRSMCKRVLKYQCNLRICPCY